MQESQKRMFITMVVLLPVANEAPRGHYLSIAILGVNNQDTEHLIQNTSYPGEHRQRLTYVTHSGLLRQLLPYMMLVG